MAAPEKQGPSSPPRVADPQSQWLSRLDARIATALAVVAALLYANTLAHGWVLDDNLILAYANVKKGVAGIPHLWTTELIAGLNHGTLKVYRPLAATSFALDWTLFGPNPVGAHLVQVLLYGLSAALTYLAAAQFFSSAPAAALITLLVLSHPLRTEVVANIKSRDELLAYLGVAGAWLFLTLAARQRPRVWPWAALACFALALFAKESAVMFLFLTPFIYARSAKTSVGEGVSRILPFAAVAAGWLVIRTAVVGLVGGSGKLSVLDNSLTAIQSPAALMATKLYVIFTYMRLLVFPHPLVFDYSFNTIGVASFTSWQAWTALIVLAALVWLVVRTNAARDELAFGVLWLLVMMFVTSNLVMLVGSTVGERFLFTPLVGLSIAVVFGAFRVFRVPVVNDWRILLGRGAPVAVLVLALSAAGGWQTIKRNRAWKNDATLFATDIHTNPHSVRILSGYGRTLNESAAAAPPEGRRTFAVQAQAVESEAVRQYPLYLESWLELSTAEAWLGNCGPAIEAATRGHDLNPTFMLAISRLALANFNCQQYAKAAEWSEKLVADPAFRALGYKLIGGSAMFLGQPERALRYLTLAKEADQTDPQVDTFLSQLSGAPSPDDETQYQLAYGLYTKKELAKAAQALEGRTDARSLALLGLVAYESGNYRKAADAYERSITAKPDDARVYNNLGNTRLLLNQADEAIANYEKAIAIAPNYRNPYANLVAVHTRLGHADKAREYQAKLDGLPAAP